MYIYDISRDGDVGDALNAVGDDIVWIRNREPVRLGHTSGRAGVPRGSSIQAFVLPSLHFTSR